MRALTAGVVYFGVVFAVGFCLGVPRTLVLLPLVGATWAVVIELPVILTLAWWLCARILRRLPLSLAEALLMGATAFGFLLLGETLISVLLVGRDLSAHLALYAEAPHRLGLAGQVAFALFPFWQVKRGPPFPWSDWR
jgi:hypothetical protein